MSTKFCPNCGAEVPDVANLCKHCFHDFNVVQPKKKSPFWTILFLAFGTSLVAAGAFAWQHSAGASLRVTVDEETESIVFTTTYADRTEADRVPFKDISSIELNRNASPLRNEIEVISTDGERYLFAQSNNPLDIEAQRLSENTKRPLVIKDDSPGAKHMKK